MIFQEKQHHDMRTVALVLFSFLLPIAPRAATWVVAIWFVLWLIGGQPLKYYSNLKKFVWWPLPLLFGWYLVALGWSNEIDIGLRLLETMLSLIIFPLLLLMGPDHRRTTIFPVRVAFILGLTIAMLICLMSSAWTYYQTGVAAFSYKDLGSILSFHPTYFALYLNFGIVLAAQVWLKGRDFRYLYRLFILLSIVFIVLLAARMQLILFLLVSLGLFWWYMNQKGKMIRAFIGTAMAGFLLLVLIWTIPTTRHRLQLAVQEFRQETPEEQNVRWVLWEAAYSVWKAAPVVGHGTGEVVLKLESEYIKMDCEDCLKGPLNAHNQFLQTAAETGIIGWIIFLLVLLLPWFIPDFKREHLFIAFLLLFGASCLTESMLATQRGTMFFGFFYTLFLWDLVSARPREEISAD